MRKLVLVLALFASGWGAPPPKIVKCTMSVDGLLDVFLNGKTLRMSFPHVLVFDKDGGLVYTGDGYGSSTAREIERATYLHAKKNASRVEAFAAYLKGDDGKLLDPATLKGTPTVVQIGADWCKPCHQLESELRRVGGITLVLADGDTQKRQSELQDALAKRLRH